MFRILLFAFTSLASAIVSAYPVPLITNLTARPGGGYDFSIVWADRTVYAPCAGGARSTFGITYGDNVGYPGSNVAFVPGLPTLTGSGSSFCISSLKSVLPEGNYSTSANLSTRRLLGTGAMTPGYGISTWAGTTVAIPAAGTSCDITTAVPIDHGTVGVDSNDVQVATLRTECTRDVSVTLNIRDGYLDLGGNSISKLTLSNGMPSMSLVLPKGIGNVELKSTLTNSRATPGVKEKSTIIYLIYN